jgi:hypothetical protein
MASANIDGLKLISQPTTFAIVTNKFTNIAVKTTLVEFSVLFEINLV